ncbi:MAG: TIGR02584 family CRISPR-associated protein [Deltaproteobacteria bacterium]|nr:TIGR02584 family CRISPR-associated protein [Deltaproteobacteria bacterium]
MKNILLAVTGLSPQVVTETLFALHQSSRRIDAVHVITTRDGKDMIYTGLLAEQGGHYYRYLDEYGIDPNSIDFSHRNIHVITDEHGVEIPDISNESDNEHLLRKCLELSFNFTRSPDTSVLFSVAGGRKTMSSCLTLAAQMYGRPQDRIYHVLVSPEFESNRDFYYPPKTSRQIELKDNKGRPFYKDAAYAQVDLIHIPFVSIRSHLSADFLKEPKDPGTLMLSLIREEKTSLTVNLINRKITYRSLEMDMMPAHLALYSFFIMQKKECTKEVDNCGSCTDCFLDIQTIFERQRKITDLYKKISTGRPLDEMSDTGITGLSSENFNMYKGKIKSDLLKSFGPYSLKDLEIASQGARPNTRYGIRMDKGKIEIVF